ncbi:MAG: SRPBCC domain-containing protein [Melioribacter sp.]|nr:SRPBCC domain-containing protein [Melioribacter sp.]
MKTTDDLIIVEQTFNASLESVWDAITDINMMRKWYFNNIPDFKASVGFTTQFDVTNGDRNFRHQWKVTEVIPYKLINYEWTFNEYEGRSNSLFELSENVNSTTLKLTVKVLEDFPDDVEEFKRESCIAGWNYFINNQLKQFID